MMPRKPLATPKECSLERDGSKFVVRRDEWSESTRLCLDALFTRGSGTSSCIGIKVRRIYNDFLA
jgi:hypothetical protein